MRTCPRPGRRGLTMMELLIAIGIIVALAALAVLIAPGIRDKHKVTRGVDLLEQWLLIARQRALRDKAPRGVRLLVDADNLARGVQYVEEPEPYSGGVVTLSNPTTAVFTAPDDNPGFSLSGGYGPDEPDKWPVQPGDYLQLTGAGTSGQMYRIGAVAPNAVTVPAATLPAPLTTADYRIHRAPRPLAGEDVQKLPAGVVVDMTPDPKSGAPLWSRIPWEDRPAPGGGTLRSYDVLFAPSGAVVRAGGRTGRIMLWVRDDSQPAGASAEQTLVVVYTRTGLITAHPIDITRDQNGNPINPYRFTQDGRSSGL